MARIEQGVSEAEYDISFKRLSVLDLLEGIHFTNDNLITTKLDELVEGQSEIKAVATENQTLLAENQALLIEQAQQFEQFNRHFSRHWNLEMAKFNAQCPNCFVLLPCENHPFSWTQSLTYLKTLVKESFQEEYRLHLLCQHPPQPHLINGEDGYVVSRFKDWWVQVAPWLKILTDYLRYIPKMRGLAEAYDEQFFEEIESSLNIFEYLLKKLPEFETDNDLDRFTNERIGNASVEGPALRALYHFLH